MGERVVSKAKRKADPSTEAFHAQNADGTAHVVGIKDLQVLITKHEGYWFAQGLEIDYGAEGKDLDDVRRAFEYGLAATIAANLREFRTIEHMLRSAPDRVRGKLKDANINARYSQLSQHLFPFRIEFIEAA